MQKEGVLMGERIQPTIQRGARLLAAAGTSGGERS